MEDKKIICKDCGQEFDFTAREQEFYQERNLSEPKRCKKCREAKKNQASTPKKHSEN